MERKREVERKRQREIERERERERQRQAEEEEDRKRQMEQERERLRLQLEREQREREIQRQQEMIREREMKIQQEYEENEQRMQFERGQRAAMDCDQETFHHMREMDMLREREAALEQEMAFRDQRRPPPRQDIPSLLTMPKSKTTDGSKPDLYDPLHPTDDEENVQDLKRKHSDGELQVRIHRDNDDRDVLDPPQKKHAGAKLEIPSSGGIQPTKEMLYQMRPKMSASLEWICHVCNVKCHEVMNYHQHMMGKRHQAMMSHITEVAEAKTDEAFKTLRAEGHVDRIRRGFESHRPSSKNVQQTYFCDVCTTYIFCEREAHNRSEEHQTALKVMERRCKVCNKSFKSLSAFMNHCNTINHRMSFEVQQEKGKIEATKIVEESKKLKKRRDKVFVTVDEVGYEPDDNKAVQKTSSDDGTLPDPKQETKSKPEVVTLKGSSEQSQPIVAVLSADPVPSVQSEPKDLATPDILNPTPSSQLSLPSFDNVLEEMKKEPEPWSMQDLVSYNPNSIVGQEYVIPVTGFFCKLCRKFYNSENSARVIHCKSQAHFTNLKKLYEEMQLAAQITKEVKDPKEESSQEESLKEDSSKDESSEQEECQEQKEETAKDTKPESEDKKKETVIKQEDTETVQSVTADTESKPEEEPLSSKEDADEESKVEK
ncbi:hypothetical protein BSL78_12492 [Apostichopus japonicus]|uniref:Matrin-type domain-containing protein n=1 Tax=Stichopus japonicus TaxID=307972 RepID=A0A2G8KRL3_STIJA|nr:hypothetical protein BSL78_12492 [Apostichopus japonicus]